MLRTDLHEEKTRLVYSRSGTWRPTPEQELVLTTMRMSNQARFRDSPEAECAAVEHICFKKGQNCARTSYRQLSKTARIVRNLNEKTEVLSYLCRSCTRYNTQSVSSKIVVLPEITLTENPGTKKKKKRKRQCRNKTFRSVRVTTTALKKQ